MHLDNMAWMLTQGLKHKRITMRWSWKGHSMLGFTSSVFLLYPINELALLIGFSHSEGGTGWYRWREN